MKAFALVPAAPIGVGIAHSIEASALRDEPESPEAWVFFCTTAAEQAHAATLADPPIVKLSDEEITMRMLFTMGNKLDGKTLATAERDDQETGPVFVPLEGPELQKAAKIAASLAFRLCMPALTGRRATQSYIACVAAGVGRGYLIASDAKSMLYTAQLALSAYPSRKDRRARK